MSATEQKPEMTKEEFVGKYKLGRYRIHDADTTFRSMSFEVNEQAMADLRSVIRGELIRYDNYLARNRWGLREIATPEQSVDEFLNNNQ